MAYQEDVVPASVLAFLTKSETRCYPFCSHPTCWQSLEREVRNIPRYMPPPLKHKVPSGYDTGLPSMAIHDIMGQNKHNIMNQEKEVLPAVLPPPNYLPMLQRWKEEKVRLMGQLQKIKQAEIYEINIDADDDVSPDLLKRNVPQFYVWVPNPKHCKLKHREDAQKTPTDSSQIVKDLTEQVLPKYVEDERIAKQVEEGPVFKKKLRSTGAMENKPRSPRLYRKVQSPKYDGLQDLFCLPREIMQSILSCHSPREFRNKERVNEILNQYGILEMRSDDKMMRPKKLDLHDAKDKSPHIFESSKPVFLMDSLSNHTTEKHSNDSHKNTSCDPSRETTPVWLSEVIQTDRRVYTRPLPKIRGAPKTQQANMAAIGLGLPTLPGGVHTTKTFSYTKKRQMDLTLGPMLHNAGISTTPERLTSGGYSRATNSPAVSMLPHAPSAFHNSDHSMFSTSHAHVNTPVSPMIPEQLALYSLDTIEEREHLPLGFKRSLENDQPMVRGHKILPKPPLSPTSSISTWPNILEEQAENREVSAKSGHTLNIRMPVTSANIVKLPSPPPPSPDPTIISRHHSNAEQMSDDHMIVIRSSARSHDSLSMPPMLEEGAESDETMSISACPPDNLDDSSLHVTPVQTSVSPVNGHQHWVKKGVGDDGVRKQDSIVGELSEDQEDTVINVKSEEELGDMEADQEIQRDVQGSASEAGCNTAKRDDQLSNANEEFSNADSCSSFILDEYVNELVCKVIEESIIHFQETMDVGVGLEMGGNCPRDDQNLDGLQKCDEKESGHSNDRDSCQDASDAYNIAKNLIESIVQNVYEISSNYYGEFSDTRTTESCKGTGYIDPDISRVSRGNEFVGTNSTDETKENDVEKTEVKSVMFPEASDEQSDKNNSCKDTANVTDIDGRRSEVSGVCLSRSSHPIVPFNSPRGSMSDVFRQETPNSPIQPPSSKKTTES